MAVAAITSLVLTGCDSHAPTSSRSDDATIVSTSPTSSSAFRTPTSPAASSVASTNPATAASAAFTHYLAATYEAQRAPRQPGQAYKPAANFPSYSFDPIRTQENAYISSLAATGEAFRGTPPMPRVKVVGSDPGAKPYPTAVLTNCPTPAPTWAAYDTKTGKPVAYANAKVPPPYLATATMIFYQGHWGVQKVRVDTGHTCSG